MRNVLLAVGENGWSVLVVAAIALAAWFQDWRRSRDAKTATLDRAYAANERAVVAARLEHTDTCVNQKLDTIHGLVNSDMLAQKHLTAVLAQRVAELSDTDADRAVAASAWKVYAVHKAAQERSDAKEAQ